MAQETKKTSRRQREIERHRDEILEAAKRVFAEKGYVSSSMEDIAREAEFSVGTLYNLFKGKEDLYAALLNQKWDAVEHRLLEAISSSKSPVERIQDYFQTCIDMFWEDPLFFRLFFHQTTTTVSDVRAGFTPRILERYERFLKRLENLFEEGIRLGVLRPLASHMLVLLLEGIIRSYLSQLSLRVPSVRDPEEERPLWEFFLRGTLTHPPASSAIPLP